MIILGFVLGFGLLILGAWFDFPSSKKKKQKTIQEKRKRSNNLDLYEETWY